MKATSQKVAMPRWPLMLLATTVMVGVAAFAQAEGGPETRRSRIDGVEQLAAKLVARERAIERREASLKDRESDLAAAEDRLMQRMEALEELRAAIDEKLEGFEEDEERRREAFKVMVEKMKAKDAAPMVDELSPELAVDLLDRMNRTKAGKLLAELPPVVAADLASRLTAPVEIP